jgi:hypothetical protein
VAGDDGGRLHHVDLGPASQAASLSKRCRRRNCRIDHAATASLPRFAAANPGLLDAMDAKLAVRFYESFRMGTPDRALDVFGAWSARNADLACEFSNDRTFDGDTRYSLAQLAIFTTQQLPDHYARLQNEFLQLPDGRCSLPVAYTLTYSYLGRRKAADWMAFLDAKLADPTVVADLRVNWLIARSFAEEHGTKPPAHYPLRWSVPQTAPLLGRSFLDQAVQAAQTPIVKLRAAREIAGRLAWAQEFQLAKDLLQPLSDSMPDAQKPLLAGWLQQLDGYLAAQASYQQNRQASARKAYLATLQARRTQAAAAGDTDTVSRYDAIINAGQANP